MFVVINAPNGILSDWCSVVGTYPTLDKAREAMRNSILDTLEPGIDDMDDYSIDSYHGTCYLSRSDAPEWHIFEIPGTLIPFRMANDMRRDLNEMESMYADEELNEFWDADDIAINIARTVEELLS